MDFDERLHEFSSRVLGAAISIEEKNNYTEAIFESIKHVNEYGQEYWCARELQVVLEYGKWDNFKNVITKAIETAKNSVIDTSLHFADIGKSSRMPNGGEREIGDVELSRYACYLVVLNADPSKEIIALGKTYFAVKTRQQELIEQYDTLDYDHKRLSVRKQMVEHNKLLVAAAKDAGVETTVDYAIFQNHGYMGLYGGLKAQDIKIKMGLKKNQQILDHMGYEELAANLFRATQTESKLRRDNIQGKKEANDTHFNVGKEIRDTIERIGGTMPEDLPTEEKSIKQIEKEHQARLK